MSNVYLEDAHGYSHYDMVTFISPAQELQVDVYLRMPMETVTMTWSLVAFVSLAEGLLVQYFENFFGIFAIPVQKVELNSPVIFQED
jgi:hypothetical protein